jgi:hypothetical protein
VGISGTRKKTSKEKVTKIEDAAEDNAKKPLRRTSEK